ncbi:phosphoribosyl-AMP cyclohydrolase [Enteractinococcus helveticum]|uniref:Phosphoribosyl-AMP cyclohydrolase n=1 Tax=Enteractinococcus helveticum TaxID=1837282 RepID=A0A1B7LXC5_9MICC|nr:phosphoribosyl-AMP cyclohydrolase [Enteractinococcus helveticum]OAV59836.1 phosphoribosyl-AMP cyclohydrolase [Enteractinococcus helveticum]
MNISEVSPPESDLDPQIVARLKRNPDGLLPAIVQDAATREVLMLGYMNDQALHMTLTTGRAWYWSRSRGEYWRKGDTSGNVQHVVSVALDCDADTLLVQVHQIGPACHTGTPSCFTDRELTVTGTQDSSDHMKESDA